MLKDVGVTLGFALQVFVWMPVTTKVTGVTSLVVPARTVTCPVNEPFALIQRGFTCTVTVDVPRAGVEPDEGEADNQLQGKLDAVAVN